MDKEIIQWRLHLQSSIHQVFQAVATDKGRASFWAESAIEDDGMVHFVFPNGLTWDGMILARQPPHYFAIRYFGNSVAAFRLEDDGKGGTDLTLTDNGVPEEDRAEVLAGWVSVLMALKAAVDFGVDLRNHDAQRHWDTGYVNN